MKKPTLLVIATEIALIATAVGCLVLGRFEIAVIGIACVVVVLVNHLASTRTPKSPDGRTIAVGTVRTIGGQPALEGDNRQVFVEVVAVSGETFIGKLVRSECGSDLSVLRPGLVVLVAFDPAAREQLSLPDDVLAVHAAWVASL